jgi:hypothetical protein
MPRVGFEPMIPVVERTNAFHALDRAATVMGTIKLNLPNYSLYIYIFFHISFQSALLTSLGVVMVLLWYTAFQTVFFIV